jgi:hypothetical protein
MTANRCCAKVRDAPVDIQVNGLLPPAEVIREPHSADVMPFVRGAIPLAAAAPSPSLRAETSGPVEERGDGHQRRLSLPRRLLTKS